MNVRKGKNRKRAGVTLVELTVVLAIMAIVTTIVVSFSALVSAQVRKNTARADFYNNSALIQEDLRVWLAENDSPKAPITTGQVQAQFETLGYDGVTLVVKTNEYGTLFKCILTCEETADVITFTLFSRCGATLQQGGAS